MEPLLSVKDVARLLKLTTRTVYSLLESGQLQGIKIGKVWRVTEEDLKAFIEKSKQ